MLFFQKSWEKIFTETFGSMTLDQFFTLNKIPKDVTEEGMRNLTNLLLSAKDIHLPGHTTVVEALTILEILKDKNKYIKDYPEIFSAVEEIKSENSDNFDFETYKREQIIENVNYEHIEEGDPSKSLEEELQEIDKLKTSINDNVETLEILKSFINKNKQTKQ